MTLHAIQAWQQTARPDASEKDASLALGLLLEEVAELLEEFETESLSDEYLIKLAHLVGYVETVAYELKSGQHVVAIKKGSRANLSKELADVVVTAVGLGHVLGIDVPRACARVNGSNYSKFVSGAPVYDSNGKVIKGPFYVAADMTDCY